MDLSDYIHFTQTNNLFIRIKKTFKKQNIVDSGNSKISQLLRF